MKDLESDIVSSVLDEAIKDEGYGIEKSKVAFRSNRPIGNFIYGTAKTREDLIKSEVEADPSKNQLLYAWIGRIAGQAIVRGLGTFYDILDKDFERQKIEVPKITGDDVMASVRYFEGRDKLSSSLKYLDDLNILRPNTVKAIRQVTAMAKNHYEDKMGMACQDAEDMNGFERGSEIAEVETLSNAILISRFIERALER